MSHTIHAFDFLAKAGEQTVPAVCAAFGDDSFLKRLVLKQLKRLVVGDDPNKPVASYDCQESARGAPDWRDVADELASASLFSAGSLRLVILERADGFVSANRQKLEDYVAKPRSTS